MFGFPIKSKLIYTIQVVTNFEDSMKCTEFVLPRVLKFVPCSTSTLLYLFYCPFYCMSATIYCPMHDPGYCSSRKFLQKGICRYSSFKLLHHRLNRYSSPHCESSWALIVAKLSKGSIRRPVIGCILQIYGSNTSRHIENIGISRNKQPWCSSPGHWVFDDWGR